MTPVSIKKMLLLAQRFAVLPAALLLSTSLRAQEPDTAVLNRAMVKYANQNSVILNYERKLVLKFEDGELMAESKTKIERLLVADLSPSTSNQDYVYDGYMASLSQLDASAYIPQKTGGFKQTKKYATYVTGAGDGISDAKYLVTSFTGLTKGSFIRVTASQDHPELTYLPLYTPYNNYPVAHSVFEVVVPTWVDIKFVVKGENTNLIKQTREEKNGNIIYRFISDNVPVGKHFNNVPSSLYTVPVVISYISSYRLPGTTKDSLMLSDPEHLNRKEYKFIRGINVKQDTNISKLVAQITKGDVTKRAKAEHLYNWVQKNIHYVGFEAGLGGWVPREADTVLKKKYGDCKDMSSLLMQMGRMAGLETYFASIGTTIIPFNFEETPIPGICNHMICALKLDNEWIFMDGTHPNLPFGANRDDIQGKEAFIAMDDNHHKIVTIPTQPAEQNVTIDSTFIHISDRNDGNLEGRVSQHLKGYAAWNLGYSFYYLTKDKEEREKVVNKLTMRGSNKYELDSYNLNISDTGSKSITMNAKFNIEGGVGKLGKDYIVNMNLLHHFEDDYIDTTERKAAWYHEYKYIQKEVVVFEIPQGCKVTYLPKNATGKLNDLWNYSITYKNDGKKITLIKEYKLNTIAVGRSMFAENNKAIQELEKQYKESVVLTAK